jgi:two-component system CheB/CheR fusion protein
VVEDARRVLNTLQKEEKEVKTKDGRWHLQRVVPYVGRNEEITGVLLTFFDLDERRILEAALNYTQKIVDGGRASGMVLAVLDRR